MKISCLHWVTRCNFLNTREHCIPHFALCENSSDVTGGHWNCVASNNNRSITLFTYLPFDETCLLYSLRRIHLACKFGLSWNDCWYRQIRCSERRLTTEVPPHPKRTSPPLHPVPSNWVPLSMPLLGSFQDHDQNSEMDSTRREKRLQNPGNNAQSINKSQSSQTRLLSFQQAHWQVDTWVVQNSWKLSVFPTGVSWCSNTSLSSQKWLDATHRNVYKVEMLSTGNQVQCHLDDKEVLGFHAPCDAMPQR